jgi:hypothetical protein
MRDYERKPESNSFSLQPLFQIIRALGALFGMAIMLVGVVCVARVFSLIYRALHAPVTLQALLREWTEAVGGAQLDIIVAGTTLHGANYVALGVLGGGGTVLAWIGMGLIVAGAKTVSLTLSDHEAIKRLLAETLGPRTKPQPDRSRDADAQ